MLELELGESIGWDHGEAQVHRAVWQGREVVIKRHREARKYARERHGYLIWEQTGLLPELLHADAQRLELLLERIPTTLALGQPQTEAMYRAAGAALRQLHDVAPRGLIFDDGRGDMRSVMGRYLPRTEGVLPEKQVRRVARNVAELLQGPFPGVVLRHGDYTARNWLWNGSRLTVIDTEMARPGPAVLDMGKLTNDGLSAELAQAFQFGYGRPWTPQESAFLNVALCFQALTLAVWCSEHGDPEGVLAMQAALDRLLS